MDTKQTNAQPTIATYVSDMLALVNHISEPLDHQRKDDAVARHPGAKRVIDEASRIVESQIAGLKARLEAVGGHPASSVKSGVAAALGAVAAAIGDVRKTEVSKYLRDDYAALALASASYTMLHTTALAMGDRSTATLAEANLRETAQVLMRVSATLPSVVLTELATEGVAVDPTVRTEAERNVEQAWKPNPTSSN